MKKMKCCDTWCHAHNTLFHLLFMFGPKKLDCKFVSNLSNFVLCSTLAYWFNSWDTMKIKCCECQTLCNTHNFSFYFQCMNEPNKLECFSWTSFFIFVQCNNPGYWSHLYVTKKIKCCDNVTPALRLTTFQFLCNA